MSITYMSVFFLRAFWGFTYFFGVNPVMNYSARSSASDYYTSMTIFYIIAEILPTGMIVVVFHVFLTPNNETEERQPLSAHQGSVNPHSSFYYS
jgi:hypothetical protein